MLHDLGEIKVKHGVRIHLYNLYNEDAGNPALPHKFGGEVAAPSLVLPETAKRKMTPAVASIALGLVVLPLVIAGLFSVRKARALNATDTIIVGDFNNTTGEALFDNTVRRGLIVQLDQSPFLNLVSEERIQETLHSRGRTADSALTSELTQDLCQQVGSKAYLGGSIENSNGHYTLTLRAVDCRTGRKLANEQVQAIGKDDVLKAISQLGDRIREDLGESTDSIHRFDVSLDTNTPSLEALKAYASGMDAVQGRGHYPKVELENPMGRPGLSEALSEQYAKAAVPFFQQAIHWDSNFALGYSALATCYLGILESENATKAYQLRDRVGQRQRFVIENTYYGLQEWEGHPQLQEANEL